MTDSDNVAMAERELAAADRIANSDSWQGDREPYCSRHIATAQVYATLAVAEEMRAVAKATYSGAV